MSSEKEYKKIQKKIKRKKKVYFHFGLYAIVIFFLFIINSLTLGHGPRVWWYLFPAAAWGTAVAIHALAVFGFSNTGLFGEDWESQKIAEELAKRGSSLNQEQTLDLNELDVDQHLDLKKVAKKARYDEQDFV